MANKNFTEFSLAGLYTGGYIVGYINSGVNGERRFDISGFALQSDLHDAATVVGNGINLTGQAISLNLGTGAAQVSSGTHTHAQLHDAVTIVGYGLALTGQAINLNFGLGPDQVSSGNHIHIEYVGTGDSRLTDARTPTAHTHGNITNSGTIGHLAGYSLITATGGLVQTLLRTELPWATGVAPDCNEGFSRFVNLTGNMVINPPTNGRDGVVFKLRALATGASRTLTFHTDIKKPTGITYTATIASGSTRMTELEHNGTSWLLIKNLEFTA